MDSRRTLFTLDGMNHEIDIVPLAREGFAVVSKADWHWLNEERGLPEPWSYQVPHDDHRPRVCGVDDQGRAVSLARAIIDAGRLGTVVKV